MLEVDILVEFTTNTAIPNQTNRFREDILSVVLDEEESINSYNNLARLEEALSAFDKEWTAIHSYEVDKEWFSYNKVTFPDITP